MAKKRRPRSAGPQRFSEAQLQAFRARQERVVPREEIEAREAEKIVEEGGIPQMTSEQISLEYAGVRAELGQIAIIGGIVVFLLIVLTFFIG